MDEVTLPTRSVAGLDVPLDLVPRIIVALRAEYPTLTSSVTDDDAAVRAVLHYWVTSTLASYESKKAEEPVDGAVEAARQQYALAAAQAREKALQDGERITGAPSTNP